MKTKITKQTLFIALAVAAITTIGASVITPQLIGANKPIDTYIDFSATTAEDPIIMKKGETKVIAFDVIAPPAKDLNLKVGVVEVGEELRFQATGEQKLPEGMSASVNKKLVQLKAQADNGLAIDGLAKKDVVLATITTQPDIKSGDYTLGLVLYSEQNIGEGSGSTHYFRIHIPE